MPFSAPKSLDIREHVERFHVCRDVWSEYASIKHKNRQICFELDLSGSHNDPKENPEPGCAECLEILQALGAHSGHDFTERSRLHVMAWPTHLNTSGRAL